MPTHSIPAALRCFILRLLICISSTFSIVMDIACCICEVVVWFLWGLQGWKWLQVQSVHVCTVHHSPVDGGPSRLCFAARVVSGHPKHLDDFFGVATQIDVVTHTFEVVG